MRSLLDRENEHGDRVEREAGEIVWYVYGMVRSEAGPLQDHLRNDILHLCEGACQPGASVVVPRAQVYLETSI